MQLDSARRGDVPPPGYEELTLRALGDVLGVTESRVSRLHMKAILRLTAHLSGATREPAEM